MIYPILILSIIFIALGFIVTEDNAKYLLSGYNTMSEEQRKKVNIKAYIPYFRKFHILLGFSVLVFGVISDYFFGEAMSGSFLVLYIVMAYIYFIVMSSKFSKDGMTKWDKIGLVGLSMLLLFLIIGLMGKFLKF